MLERRRSRKDVPSSHTLSAALRSSYTQRPARAGCCDCRAHWGPTSRPFLACVSPTKSGPKQCPLLHRCAGTGLQWRCKASHPTISSLSSTHKHTMRCCSCWRELQNKTEWHFSSRSSSSVREQWIPGGLRAICKFG